MSALALSVLLSLVSAVAYAGGAIVQEQVAVSSPVAQYAPLRRPAWWAAVALNGLGGLLHVVALALGPLSLVQPLGALTIVFALPMAALFVGRRAGATAWRGALMATVGLAGLLSLVGASDAQSLNTAQRVGAALVTGGVVVALMIAGRAAHRHPAVRSILLATASGIAFGMSSVFTKTVAVDWTGGVSATDLPSLAVIGVLATAGMVLSQASYRGAGLAAPLATLTVVNPVVAAVVGITMFGETFRYGTTGTALALSCGVVAAGGLILLTTERIARESAGEAASDATPADGAPADPADPAPVKEVPAGGAPVAVAAAAARVEVERAALVSAAAGSGTVPAVAGSGTVPAPAAQARSRKRAADEERERRDEQSARLSGKVLVPASAPDAPAAEETFDALVPGRGPAEGDYPPPSFGPFYGGPFVPPPAFGRRGVRIRS
ncbi:DMT family transporter [Streptomyces olivaceus]|uniref:DMT family transporter n=1 Tax=Streptomyces olivaceus TaxID=47716 RepID=UPI001CCCEBEA|nr:DMT family transporter [Streptomyces olivaceus]MBZ6284329.1 DMT family transporter [Streptomyces olivaceus]